MPSALKKGSIRGLVVVKNVRHVLSQMKKFRKRIASAAYVSTKRSLVIVEGEALRLVSGPMRAVDTGLMRSTLSSHISSFTDTHIEGVVGVGVHYAIYVHEGMGYHKSRRPFLTTALKNKKRTVSRLIRKSIQRELEGKTIKTTSLPTKPRIDIGFKR